MADYTHRKTVDGAWDSICMTCFQTAATSVTEPELRESEPLHKCYGSPRLPPVAQVADFLGKRAA